MDKYDFRKNLFNLPELKAKIEALDWEESDWDPGVEI